MKIKKVQGVCLILACAAATGLIGCGKTNETPKKHEAITFMAPYLEVDSFIEEVHKTYPEIEIEVVPYSGANTTVYLNTILEENDLPDFRSLSRNLSSLRRKQRKPGFSYACLRFSIRDMVSSIYAILQIPDF